MKTLSLDAADIVPVIRCVDQRPKKVRPHPFSREIVVNADRQVGDMGLSSCPAKQPAIGDDLSAPFAYDRNIVRTAVLHCLPGLFHRLEGLPQRAVTDARQVEQFGQGFGIIQARCAQEDVA